MMKPYEFAPSRFWILLLSFASGGAACADTKQEAQILRPRETIAGLSVPYDEKLPPLNPYLADSPWPMMHQGPYNQASSPFPGPETSDALTSVLVETGPSMAHLYTPLKENEAPLLWGSNFSDVYLAAATVEGVTLVADLEKDRKTEELISGVYTVLDLDGVLYVPNGATIDAYAHSKSEAGLAIQHVRSVDFSNHGVRSELVGLNMTYDGWLAFATGDGQVGVVNRNFTAWKLVDLGADEEVTNSIAVDEDGGIYVVTSKSMVRVQWTGKKLSLAEQDGAWRSDYETGADERAPGRLGTGSGSTPTLMGIKGEDRFVVITDGQPLMHIVLFWRGAIPADWAGLGNGISRRIAAQVPITFGDPETTSSVSEQSVLVYGNRAVVVNNDYGPNAGSGYMPVLSGALSLGVEQFAWDPETRSLQTSWANPNVPCPNGIPAMSAYSKLMYCVGKRGNFWTVEALDWQTGKLVFSQPTGEGIDYNSVYAATEVGPERNIITGTAGGLVDLRARK